jgi:hypothetical protein
MHINESELPFRRDRPEFLQALLNLCPGLGKRALVECLTFSFSNGEDHALGATRSTASDAGDAMGIIARTQIL